MRKVLAWILVGILCLVGFSSLAYAAETANAGEENAAVVEGTAAGDAAVEAAETSAAGDAVVEAAEASAAGDAAVETAEATAAGNDAAEGTAEATAAGNTAAGNAAAKDTTADDKAEANPEPWELFEGEPYMVGVVLNHTDSSWAQEILACLNAVGEPLGVTFQVGDCGENWENELQVIQNFAVGGFDGIVNLHPGTVMPQAMSLCEEYGMYMVTSTESAAEDEDNNAYSSYAYFAGEVWEDELANVDAILTDMEAKGAREFGLAGLNTDMSAQSDGRMDWAFITLLNLEVPDEMVHQWLDQNIADAIKTLMEKCPDLDAIFVSDSADLAVYEQLISPKKDKKILVNCYDPDESAVDAFRNGTLSYASAGTCADAMIAFVLLYNAMSGKKMMQDDGSAPSISMEYLLCTSAEDMENVVKYCSAANPPYTLEELWPFISGEASYNDLEEFAGQFSMEDLLIRRGILEPKKEIRDSSGETDQEASETEDFYQETYEDYEVTEDSYEASDDGYEGTDESNEESDGSYETSEDYYEETGYGYEGAEESYE